jgi:hypothetical protein
MRGPRQTLLHPLGVWLFLSLSGAAVGCDDEPLATRPTPSAKPAEKAAEKASLLDPSTLNEALKSLIDPLPQPVRILTVTALHEQVILQVQSATDPTAATEYRFRAATGKVTGPSQVTLLGGGKLHDNLFPLQAANPQVAGQVVAAVEGEYQSQGLRIRKLVMIRNLPRSRDIQFRVYLDGPAGELLLNADKNGRLLGPPEPAPDPSR